jgi:RHS repeat-associated protein
MSTPFPNIAIPNELHFRAKSSETFGVALYGRTWSSEGYRYGFNGKEKDSETTAGAYDFGARIYDGRLGRWLSADGKFKKYPSHSPYHFGFNNPILVIDSDGNENIVVVGAQHDNSAGNKLMFVHQAIRQLKRYFNNEPNESRTMVLCTESYTTKQIERIERVAQKYGFSIVKVESADQVVNYLNTKYVDCSTPDEERKSDPVTNVDIYSHGKVGEIRLGYETPTDIQLTINESNATKLNPEAFSKDAIIASFACRTGMGNPNIDLVKYPSEDECQYSSLAQKISNAAGVNVKAYVKRSDYENTLSSFSDRLLLKYGVAPPGTPLIGEDKQSPALFKKRVENRENVDGATWDDEGAIHDVKCGDSPLNCTEGQVTFKPNK